jgi:hypothetical protein
MRKATCYGRPCMSSSRWHSRNSLSPILPRCDRLFPPQRIASLCMQSCYNCRKASRRPIKHMLHAHSLLSRTLLPVPPPCLHDFRYIRDFLSLLCELTAFMIFCPAEQYHKRLVAVTTLARCFALAPLLAGDRPLEQTNITTGLHSLLDKLSGSLAIK